MCDHPLPINASRLFWLGAGVPLSLERVRREAAGVARHLGSGVVVINLCRDRRFFMVGFLAAQMASCRTVLPPSLAPGILESLQDSLEDCLVVDDARMEAWLGGSDAALQEGVPPWPGEDLDAVTLYTSGSTGQSIPHGRTWGQLCEGASMTLEALSGGIRAPLNLVATVPSQHMFGLESTVMLPLLGMGCIHRGQPLFPEDVRKALISVPEPRGLITTPFHLRTCLSAIADWPPLAFLLTATAPMPADLAREAETRTGACAFEIYGSTETGALAVREPARHTRWRPLPGVELLGPAAGGWRVKGRHFPSCVIHDELEPHEDGGFTLLGRQGDLVKIAGKRQSMAAIGHLLLQAPGVSDAVAFPPGAGLSEDRVSALVVTEHALMPHLRAWLSRQLDAVFMPRPLIVVDRLPRDANGKLPRNEIERLLNTVRNR